MIAAKYLKSLVGGATLYGELSQRRDPRIDSRIKREERIIKGGQKARRRGDDLLHNLRKKANEDPRVDAAWRAYEEARAKHAAATSVKESAKLAEAVKEAKAAFEWQKERVVNELRATGIQYASETLACYAPDRETKLEQSWAHKEETVGSFAVWGRHHTGDKILHGNLYPVYWCDLGGRMRVTGQSIHDLKVRLARIELMDEARHGLAEAERKATYKETRDERRDR